MDIDTSNELETKAGIPLDAMVTHGDMIRAFETFKEANDKRGGGGVQDFDAIKLLNFGAS